MNIKFGTVLTGTFLCIVAHASIYAAPTYIDEIKKLVESKQPIPLSTFPFIKDVPLPAAMTTIFQNIKLENPELVKTTDLFKVSGTLDIAGVPIKSYFKSTGVSVQGHDALVLGIPLGWKMSDILTKFLGIPPIEQLIPQIKQALPNFNSSDVVDLEITHGALALADASFHDEEFGSFAKGLNLICTVRLLGLAEPFSKLFGEKLNELAVRGIILPSIEGSSLSAEIPGKLQLIPGIESTPVHFALVLQAVSATLSFALLPGIDLSAGFKVFPEFYRHVGLDFLKPESFKEPLAFKAHVHVTPTNGTFAGSTQGMLRDFLPGIDIGNLAVGFTIDWGLLAGGGVPLSGLSARGETNFLGRTVSVATAAGLTSAGGIENIMFVGTMAGKLSLEDIVHYVVSFCRAEQNIDLQQEIKTDSIPTISVENPRIGIVPKATSIAGKSYFRGVDLAGKVELFGATGELDFTVTTNGLNASGKLSPIIITNPIDNSALLKLTSVGSDTEGPSFGGALALHKIFFALDGKVVLNILGGITSQTKVDLSLKGMRFTSSTKLFDRFEAEIEAHADILTSIAEGLTPQRCYLKIIMKQELLKFMEQEINQFARGLVPNFDNNAQKEFERVEGEIARLDRELAEQYQQCHAANWPTASCTLFWNEITRRNVEKAGLVTYRDAILKPGVEVARGVLTALSNVSQLAGHILANGINIESFTSTANLSEFVEAGKLPHVTIKLKFMGRDLELKDMQFSFTDIPGSVGHIFNQLSKLLVGETAPSAFKAPTFKLGAPIKIR